MKTTTRDGVTLAWEERGAGPPVALIHCWGGDHTFMAPLAEALAARHRVISVDLRGHGDSDKPEGGYGVDVLADDVAAVLADAGATPAVVVGHSLGGNVALELAARHPDAVRGLALLDSTVVPPPGAIDGFRPVLAGLRTPAFADVMRQVTAMFGGFADRPERLAALADRLADNPQHVLAGVIEGLLAQDTDAAAEACTAPLLYVSSGPWHPDVDRFRSLCPQLVTAQTFGSGHYHQLEVPDQINAIVARFLAVGVTPAG